MKLIAAKNIRGYMSLKFEVKKTRGFWRWKREWTEIQGFARGNDFCWYRLPDMSPCGFIISSQLDGHLHRFEWEGGKEFGEI